jgi:hypothetical protein
VVTFIPRPLYHWETDPGIHWIRDWADPRAGLEDMVKRKLFTLGIEPDPSVVQSIALLYTDCAISAPVYLGIILILALGVYSGLSGRIRPVYLSSLCVVSLLSSRFTALAVV